MEVINIATCGIWKISSNLKQVIDYISNDEKTHIKDDLVKKLHNDLSSDVSNETNNYISGINCSPKYAFEEMKLVKESFGKEDKILGYHAFQSFKQGEVSPELAHKVGVQLAQEMWGDKYQVLIATHTNTEKTHNHFVINSVSFLDGKKCEYSRTSYAELRHLNDSICLENGLSILEEKPTRKHINYANYLKNNDYIIDYYSITKNDVDYAIQEAVTYKDFLDLIKGLGYNVYERYGKLSVRANDYKKRVRLERRFGKEYSIDNIKKRIVDINKEYKGQNNISYNRYYYIEPRSKKKYQGLQGLYKYYCYILKLYPKSFRKYKLSPAMKLEVKKLDELSNQAIFLAENNINTKDDLLSFKERNVKELDGMLSSKENLYYFFNKSEDELEKNELKIKIEKITNKSKTLRKRIKLCDAIQKRTEEMEHNLDEFKNYKEVDRNEPIK